MPKRKNTDGGELATESYSAVLAEVKQRIRVAQVAALRAVNRELVALYWEIGRLIVERQQGESWGMAIVERLAADIQAEFPGLSGFSARNIWYMRNFYLQYRDNQKLQPLVAEISWSHNLAILEKCSDDLEREFYIRMARKFGWSKNTLIHQIESHAYERTITSQTNFEAALAELTPTQQVQAKLAVKDEYLFDFLEMGDDYAERELEAAILARIEPFLREMGGVFSFVGSQFRLEVGDEEFFIDVLLYHRRLRCLVALELKIGKFLPEHAGKMNFYLAVLDDTVREADENPSIGIILCKSKNETVVEYALRGVHQPIGVATYRLHGELPEDLRRQLPAPDQVAKLLEGLE
ncbi:MAG: PDDEXK nuclease domain-containing protein [Armatimonadota bacterium]|nr:PDDEXK nuclease domain-containing protein [Armatimonadota bacterium]